MMEKDLLNKMLKDARLTPEEEAQLDVMLASEAQKTVSNAVATAPQDELNFSWRSALNERLVKESAKRRRKQRVIWTLRPAVGLALAGAMATVFWVRQPVSVAPAPHKTAFEEKLVAAHEEAVTITELNGATVATYHNPSEPKPRDAWTEADLGAL